MNLFTEAGLREELLTAITKLGYETPTEIQKESIPFILNEDRDLIALAQTGTGKTAAFGLPILHQIDENDRRTQALILCPTRELCLQITRDIQTFAENLPQINTLAVYGGSSITEQIRALKKHPQIIIGTPGRLNDMIRRKAINLSQINCVVLDEADEMLSMGFKDELETILLETPEIKRTYLFSATMSKQVEKIAKGYMNNPHKISVGSINAVKKNISHLYCVTRHRQKLQVLHRILDANPNNYSIIFCRTRIETQQVAEFLMIQGYSADALHGDLSQAQRDTVMKKFRLQNLQILVATDVAARGLDVNSLTHVIHFSLPDDPEVFVHRSGRTGRAGKNGQSICLIKADETRKLKRIEKECSIKIAPLEIPTNDVILTAQIDSIIDKLASDEVMSSDFTLPELPDLSEITKEELFEKFIYLHLKDTVEYYKNHPSIEYNSNSSDYNSDRGEERSRGRDRDGSRNNGRRRETRARRKDGKPSNESFTRFFINLGKKDSLSKGKLFDLINKNTKGKKADVGDIDILEKFSFFEVESKYKSQLLDSFNKDAFQGKKINLEIAN
ncbi:MAG: DEAD/DEAH box helicase [Flavobacteriales bacterium]|nr:DEAD/DEAH box helicase [Flavobacteriales bacterium]